MSDEKKIILMRGPPGAGKSTIAQRLNDATEDSVILSTDEFHYINGEYIYDATKAARYHEANLLRAIMHMLIGTKQIIIDNTNIHIYAMARYINAAYEVGGYTITDPIHVKHGNLTPADLAARNLHKVPEDVIKKMLSEFESLDPISTILRGRNVKPDPEYQSLAVTRDKVDFIRKYLNSNESEKARYSERYDVIYHIERLTSAAKQMSCLV